MTRNKKIIKLGKIQTTIECPTCGEKLDFEHVKQAIKDRIDQELDHILEKI